MSKELDALERIRKCLEYGDDELGDVHYFEHIEDLDIIEFAIKDYEKLKNEYDRLESFHKLIIERYNQLNIDYNKKLKALDIIKERMRIEFHEYPNGLFQVVAFPKEQTWVGLGTELYFGNCKEKYDLLKEVLL